MNYPQQMTKSRTFFTCGDAKRRHEKAFPAAGDTGKKDCEYARRLFVLSGNAPDNAEHTDPENG